MFDGEENGVDNNGDHYEIFKQRGLDDFEAVAAQTVDRADRDLLRVRVHEQALDLDPFLLLVGEVLLALALLELFVEFVNNDGNEQVHYEEGGNEDKGYVDHRVADLVVRLPGLVDTDAVHRHEHHVRPHLQRRDLEECQHRTKDIVVIVERLLPEPIPLFICEFALLVVFERFIDRVRVTLRLCQDRFIIAHAEAALEELHAEDAEDPKEEHNDEEYVDEARYGL